MWCPYILSFFGEQEGVGLPFAYVAHFVFLRDVWIRIQISAIEKQARYQLATQLPILPTHFPF
jgi:hypothetical protein